MIYIVEQTFSRPDWLAEWDAWYDGNLAVLLAVPGFRSAQRFRAADGSPRFMAMYQVDSAEVFQSEVYLKAGGNGANSVRFRPAYARWTRNLLAGDAPPPSPAPDACIVSWEARDDSGRLSGIALDWRPVVGLHRTSPWRGLGVVPAGVALPREDPGIAVYRAKMAQVR